MSDKLGQTRLRANINSYLTLYGIRQSELEGRLGISRPTYLRKCRENGFTVADLLIISSCLHTTPDKLIEGVR